MKLTLYSGGGVTGLAKECTVDVNTLDESTRAALLKYIDSCSYAIPMNLNESWSLDGDKEVPIDTGKMNKELKQLYRTMKEKLSYPRR